MPESTKTLYEKLLAVQRQVTYLQKETVGFQYKYVSSSQVLQAVRAAMDEQGLVLTVSVLSSRLLLEAISGGTDKEGKPKTGQHMTELDLEMTWVDAENPEDRQAFRWYGQGIDTGEKGVGKALTYAEKYFVLKFFHIATDADDPDAVQNKAEAKQAGKKIGVAGAKRFLAKIGELNKEEKTSLGKLLASIHVAQVDGVWQVKDVLRSDEERLYEWDASRGDDPGFDAPPAGTMKKLDDVAPKEKSHETFAEAKKRLENMGGFPQGLTTMQEVLAEITEIEEKKRSEN